MPWVIDEATGGYVWEPDEDEGPTKGPVTGPPYEPRYSGETYTAPDGTKFIARPGKGKKVSSDPATGAFEIAEGGLEWTIPEAKESGGGSTGLAIASIGAETARLNKMSDEKLAAIADARKSIDQDISRENLAWDKIKHEADLGEQIRHNEVMERLYAKDRELAEAQFKWGQETDTQKIALEEHRNRIQEAGVTGYYRPSASTAFPKVGQQIASPGLGITAPTLAREQFQAGQASAPTLPPTASPVTAQAPGVQPQATRRPATDTSMLNIRELAELHKQGQQGPPAQTQATLAPGTKPDETRINAEQRVVKRTVTEVFG